MPNNTEGDISNSAVVEGGILANLEKHYNKKALNELFDGLAGEMGYDKSRGKMRAILDRDEKHRRVTKKGKPVSCNSNGYFHWIFTLYIYGIPLEHMGIVDDEKSIRVKNRINEFWKRKKREVEEISSIEAYTLRGFKNSNTADTIKEVYEGALINYLKHFKEELLIYDYLERQSFRNGNELQAYIEAHENFFEGIEKNLTSNKKYQRLLVLPLSIQKTNNLSPKELKKLIIEHCSSNLLKHILQCLNEYPLFEEGDTISGFFMVANPPRTYHYAIFDRQYLVSEYYQYYDMKKCTPDLLYINKGKVDKVVNHYQREINKHARPHSPRFTREGLPELIQELIQELPKNDAEIAPTFSDLSLKEERASLNKKLEITKEYIRN